MFTKIETDEEHEKALAIIDRLMSKAEHELSPEDADSSVVGSPG